jgi:hypothetical protein
MMPYVELQVSDKLSTDKTDLMLLWIEGLWNSRLTSVSYQIIYCALQQTTNPVNFFDSKKYLNSEVLNLLKSVLAANFTIGTISKDSLAGSGQRLIKIMFDTDFSNVQIHASAAIERYADFTVVTYCDDPLDIPECLPTYEQRIALPYSSGKRDGILITDLTSSIFLPRAEGQVQHVSLDDVSNSVNWVPLPRFVGDMLVSKRSQCESLQNCASVFTNLKLVPGSYCLEATFVRNQCPKVLLNLHAPRASGESLDFQVSVSDRVYFNNSIWQLFIRNEGSLVHLSAYMRIFLDIPGFSVKWFLSSPTEMDSISTIQVMAMRLFRISEDWGH